DWFPFESPNNDNKDNDNNNNIEKEHSEGNSLSTTTSTTTLPQKKLNIAIVVSSFEGLYSTSGIGTVYSILADFLVARGHEVTVVYASDEVTDRMSFTQWKTLLRDRRGITLVSLPPSQVVLDNPHLVKRSYRVYQYLRDTQYDLVHFPDFEGMGYYTCLAKHSGQHFASTSLIVGLHGPSAWVIQSNRKHGATQESEFELDYMERKSVEYADHVWTPSIYIVDWLKKQGWLIPQERLSLLPFLAPVVSEDSATKHHLQQDRTTQPIQELVFFGRLEKRKGVVLLADALDLLARHDSSTFELRNIRVTFLGRASHIIIPSLEDNAPYTLYECLYRGIPFIASSTPSMIPLIDARDRDDVTFDVKPYLLLRKLSSAMKKGVTIARPTFTADKSLQYWTSFYASLENQQLRMLAASTEDSSEQQEPLVSVCIVHYNRPQLLYQALVSIEQQHYSNYEVILVDDGSNTTEALHYLDKLDESFKSRGWQLIRTANRYLGAARNTAARAARGQYLYFLDDDNAAYPQALSTYVRIAQHTEADVVTAPHSIIMTVDQPDANTPIDRQWAPLGPSLSVGLFKNCFGDANFFVRRDVFDNAGGFTEEVGVGLEDHELLAKLAIDGRRMIVAPDPLLYYRMHDTRGQMVFKTEKHLNQMRYIRPYQSAFGGDAKPVMKLLASIQEDPATLAPPTCNITITSVSPNRGPVRGGTRVLISGSGFDCQFANIFFGQHPCQKVEMVNSRQLYCVTPKGFGPETVDVIIWSKGRPSTLFAGFTYVADRAPTLTECDLDGAGNIECRFSTEVGPVKPGSSACNTFFSPGTVNILGSSPVCTFTNNDTLTLTPSSDASIDVGDTVETLPGTIESPDGELNNQESTQVKVKDRLPPLAVIKAPTETGTCGPMILDARYSLPGSGRHLKYEWKLVSAPDHQSELESIVQSTKDASLVISNSSFQAGSSYTFQLIVTNIIGLQDNSTVTVNVVAGDGLHTMIEGPHEMTISKNDLQIEAEAWYTSCVSSGEDPKITYQWTVTPPLTLGQTNSKTLFVPSDQLKPGASYVFTLNTAAADKKATATIKVNVRKTPVYTLIKGGDKTVSRGQTVTLDASQSSDPDGGNLQYSWTCTSSDGSDCPLSLPSEPIVSFNSSELPVGAYTFKVTATPSDDPKRASSAVRSIIVTDTPTINVEIDTSMLPKHIDPGQKLVFKSILVNNSIPISRLTFDWKMDAGQLKMDQPYATPTNQRNLALKSGALGASTMYTVSVHVMDKLTNMTGQASTTFRTEAVPSGGMIKTNATNGTVFDKYEVTLGKNWAADSGILGYSFRYSIGADPQEYPIGERQPSPTISTYLPPGEIKVKGYAISGNGAASSSSTSISVAQPSADDKEKVLSFITDLVTKDNLNLYDITFAIRLGNSILPPNDHDYKCVWWDDTTSLWSSEGCTTEFRSGRVVCQCNHLTQFALLGRVRAKSNLTRILIIVGSVVGCVLFAGLLVGMFVVAKRRRQAKKKDPKKPEDKKKEEAKEKKEAKKIAAKEKRATAAATAAAKKAASTKGKEKDPAAADENKQPGEERITEVSFGDENENDYILQEFKEIYEIVKQREQLATPKKQPPPVSPLTTNGSISSAEPSPATSVPSIASTPEQHGVYTEVHEQAALRIQRVWRRHQAQVQLAKELEVENLMDNIGNLLADIDNIDPLDDNNYGDDFYADMDA
ncbi:hypothetical protein SAMD00019534_080040, partial [Acytostelium subglobosum LB1]|uniref:hypothetical protein n=1 Tax=Acytostelium subglobosum LB1 TaxID=1410327 RepID=UPI000644CDA5